MAQAPAPRRPFTTPLAGAAALAAWCLLLHGSALQAGWRFDDPALLNLASQHAATDYFWQRALMLQVSYASLAPWNAAFYNLGLPWFGIEPLGHYAHQLVVLWATALATVGLVSRWLPPHLAWGAGALFLAMPPTASIAQTLMTGHYAYGLLFSVAALGAFVRGIERDRRAWGLAAAGLFALACLCKELYVLLPLAMLALPLGTARQRLRLAWPMLALWPAYLGLRVWVLGGVGGYGRLWAEDTPRLWGGMAELAAAPVRLLHAVFGPGWIGATAALLALVIVVAPRLAQRLANRRRAGTTTATTIGIGTGPLDGTAPSMPARQRLAAAFAGLMTIPVLGLAPLPGLLQPDFPYGHERLGYAIGWGVAVALVFALPRRQRGRVTCEGAAVPRGALRVAMPFALLLVLLVASQSSLVRRIDARTRIEQAQHRWLAQSGAGQWLVVHPSTPLGYAELMAQAIARVAGRPAAGVVADEEAPVALGAERGRAAWAWQDDCGCLRPLGPRYAVRVATFTRRLQAGATRALRAELALEDHGRIKVFRWQLDGEPGQLLITVRHLDTLALPRKGSITFGVDSTMPLGDPVRLRVSVECADGALIRSPLLSLPLNGGHTVRWAAAPS